MTILKSTIGLRIVHIAIAAFCCALLPVYILKPFVFLTLLIVVTIAIASDTCLPSALYERESRTRRIVAIVNVELTGTVVEVVD